MFTVNAECSICTHTHSIELVALIPIALSADIISMKDLGCIEPSCRVCRRIPLIEVNLPLLSKGESEDWPE